VNKHRAARILAEVTVCTDTEAARRFGVTTQSIGGWRKRMKTDAELADLYVHYLALLDGRWRRELEDVAIQAARDLRDLQVRTHALVMGVLDHPEEHLDEHGQPPTAQDRVRLAQGAMAELRQTLEKSAELLTHYAAIVAEPGDRGVTDTTGADGPPQTGGATSADRSSAIN